MDTNKPIKPGMNTGSTPVKPVKPSPGNIVKPGSSLANNEVDTKVENNDIFDDMDLGENAIEQNNITDGHTKEKNIKEKRKKRGCIYVS